MKMVVQEKRQTLRKLNETPHPKYKKQPHPTKKLELLQRITATCVFVF